MTSDFVSLSDIEEARKRLRGVAVTTPLDRSRALSNQAGGVVFVKCENLQRTGSFKIRGAYNRICRLDDDAKRRGVVAASAGNHAQGVALAASLNNIPSTVYMPAAASLPKVEATKRYGAEVVLTGKDFGEAYSAAVEHMEREGSVFVHPFNHPHIIAGQGTVGCEIAEQLDDIGTIIVPLGGGGLISGVGVAIKSLRPSARVIGVQAAGAAAYPPSLEQGEPVALEEMSTIADGIAANEPGELTLAHVQEYVDDVVCVSDESIAEALVFVTERMKLVVEASGAAGVAALLGDAHTFKPPVVIILSGGNIDTLLLLSVLRFGLGSSGRYFAFHTRIKDEPGALHHLLGLLADAQTNIVGVEHHREGVNGTDLQRVDVALQVETRGPDHIAEVLEKLEEAGYAVERM